MYMYSMVMDVHFDVVGALLAHNMAVAPVFIKPYMDSRLPHTEKSYGIV